MEKKHENALLKAAASLDAVIDNNIEASRLVLAIIEKKDESATVELCKRLSECAQSNSKQIVQLAVTLKNCLIHYYGYLRVCEICDPNWQNAEAKEKTLSELLGELHEMVGLEKVKAKVDDLIAYQSVQQMRRQAGFYAQKSTLHLAFTGNPGTGKTTVARIVGRIYKQLGLLSKGHFLEVSRTDLIAGYQGQTALKVKAVIERAKGGVLFIDEAYSITENDHSDSYGRECLTELTKALEDYREDLVVIVAGYTEPMRAFFASNPGLKSRFNTFIEFDDYSVSELEAILISMCKKNDYSLSDRAVLRARDIFAVRIAKGENEFANGRFVRNMYEDIVMNHARRVYQSDIHDRQELMEIIEEDLDIS